ncbi:MAG: hypothetical protein C4520_20835 [Candidatus Abyssobacteria bacterium SURF_5]|uniref:Chorismate dehydratase n=1 Tax=Abyssobacteria bacterium (strain SURF_5) TaxID=2093360 RepID=A0A3A4MY38_ABYX5|nr:MAG: hypothetical protein C4520_20835 [Candidatus Abyssubacteria bacterium SURF_5]
MSSSEHPKLRVGSVPYLNAKPLIRFLDVVGPPPLEVTMEVPSRLTELLRERRLDVALLPSIEYLRGKNYRLLPDICIASDGIVESVRVYSKVKLENIKLLGLDKSSRTSAALVRVLLKRRFGKLPKLSEISPDSNLDELKEDAILLIGDPAMKFKAAHDVHVLDLGAEWKQQTGLPFVYAIWVAREGIPSKSLVDRLIRARNDGLMHVAQLAVEASNELGLDQDVCFNYLAHTIQYQLGDRQIRGLSLFQQLAAEDGLCPGGIDIAVTTD